MSLQWTLVATFLYIEIAVVILLLLPIISPRKWQSFFKSRFLKSIGSQGNLYFTGFLLILILLFCDSIREMRRYSFGREHDEQHGHLNAELAHSMKLFRAQRNFYIAGFALFLCLVIRRIASLLSVAAKLKCDLEAAIKQGEGASKAAEALMKGAKVGGDDSKNSKEDKEVLKEISDLKEKLQKALKGQESMAKQAAGLTKEYDRLAKEHADFVNKVGKSDKKAD